MAQNSFSLQSAIFICYTHLFFLSESAHVFLFIPPSLHFCFTSLQSAASPSLFSALHITLRPSSPCFQARPIYRPAPAHKRQTKKGWTQSWIFKPVNSRPPANTKRIHNFKPSAIFTPSTCQPASSHKKIERVKNSSYRKGRNKKKNYLMCFDLVRVVHMRS